MRTLLIVVLIVSILGNFLGLYFAYKWYKQSKTINSLQNQLRTKARFVNAVGENLDTRLLFIHHSCGRIWLDDGDLRTALFQQGIDVHDATYGDEIGDLTDVCHWVPKFSDQMEKILSFNHHPDTYYTDGRQNDIIMFKSCYPNSNLKADGSAPGDPTSREMTVENYRAVFTELGEIFAKYPERTFIYATAPPLEPGSTSPENAARARAFNDWLKNEFVAAYSEKSGLTNFMVFDFFDVLADENNHLREEYRLNSYHGDSHPNGVGTKVATERFVRFLTELGLIGIAEQAAEG